MTAIGAGGLLAFEVSLVKWPDECDRLERLRPLGVPRLLLVGEDLSEFEPGDSLEDWARLPAPEDEFRVRVATLALRARRLSAAPTVDEDGLLRYRGRWIALSPIERCLGTPLVDRFGAIVDHQTLGRISWEGHQPTRNALDVHMARLRRRIARLGLEIRTVRGRGYLLRDVDVSGVG